MDSFEINKIIAAVLLFINFFVKGVKGPLPWASIMPTGGVSPTEENLKEWFAAGVHCVGIGSKLFIKNAEGAFDYAAISSKIKEALQLVKTLRS